MKANPDFAVSRNGQIIAYNVHGQFIWIFAGSSDDPARLGNAPAYSYRRVDMSADGCTIAWGSVTGDIHIWTSQNGMRTVPINGSDEMWRQGTTAAIQVSPSGDAVLSVNISGCMMLWDVEMWHVRHTVIHKNLYDTRIGIMTPDQRYAITGHGNHVVRLWDLQSENCITTFTGESAITALTTDGEVIVVGEKAGHVHVLRILDAPPKVL